MNCEIWNKILSVSERLRWLPPLIARVTLGYVFVETGWGKIHNLDAIVQFFGSIGIPYPELQAPFVSWVELIGGSLILAGLMTRLAAVPLGITMVVAILTAKIKELTGVSALFGFIEYLYLVMFFWLAVEGPGPVSLDHVLGKKLCRKS